MKLNPMKNLYSTPTEKKQQQWNTARKKANSSIENKHTQINNRIAGFSL